jgi:hypothetical protein
MELRRDEFPVALQAYEVRGDHEEFVAEQVVNSQAEADKFMNLYAGRLIKTHEVRQAERERYHTAAVHHSRTRAGIPAWIIVLIVLVILFVIAYSTGWLQQLIDRMNTH